MDWDMCRSGLATGYSLHFFCCGVHEFVLICLTTRDFDLILSLVLVLEVAC